LFSDDYPAAIPGCQRKAPIGCIPIALARTHAAFLAGWPPGPPGMRPLTARDGTKRASPAAPIWSTTLFRPGRPLLSVPAPRPERRPQEWMAEIMPGWGSSTTAICGGGPPACPARSQRGKRHFPLRSLQRRRAPRVGMHRRIRLHLTPIRGSVRLGSRSVTK